MQHRGQPDCLIAENEDEALKTVYDRHSGSDFDAELEEGKDAIKEMMQMMLGVELEGDVDLRSPEKLFVQVSEKMQQKMAQEEQVHAARCATRKKSARTLAEEKQAQEDAQNVSKSLQDVYWKLVSTLHPDKESEPAERTRKTQLMQQANSAYEKNDLLRLLELRLAAEEIDQARINALTETRLTHYNTILSERSKELGREMAMMCGLLAMHFDIPEHALSTPDQALQSLGAQIQKMKQDILKLKEDLTTFQEIKPLKQFLKAYRLTPRSPLVEAAREMGVYI